ncbi:MAG: saccharopine dehydrogenase [Bacteroidetes bacterium]|nr:saccharopine dehydrogenase [Bacteroidota bacterium]
MNQKNIVVLGAGRVGSAIAVDLSKEFDVTVTDINQEVLNKLGDESSVKAIRVDLSTACAIREMVKDFDLVIGSVPGYMGYNTVKNVIQSGKNMVDISFFPQNPFDLNELAKKAGITVVIDCGVAPGMGNIILGYHNRKMQINRFECLVGGLPVVREWPYEYKAVFSPVDVIEEYIRPARYVENSTIVVREALSDPELVYFEGLGTLESWNSDGLRTLIKTMGIPNMKEKTLRYPGTIEYLRVLRETGFFSSETVDINGKEIRPVDLTARLLFKKWKLNPGEEDFTVMRITIEGEENGKRKKLQKSKIVNLAPPGRGDLTEGNTCSIFAY